MKLELSKQVILKLIKDYSLKLKLKNFIVCLIRTKMKRH